MDEDPGPEGQIIQEKSIEALRTLYSEAKQKGYALMKFETKEAAQDALDFLEPHLVFDFDTGAGLGGSIVRETELNLFTVEELERGIVASGQPLQVIETFENLEGDQITQTRELPGYRDLGTPRGSAKRVI